MAYDADPAVSRYIAMVQGYPQLSREAELELAEEVRARMPWVEMLRMVSSGTEASMSAIRLARAATGREPVVKFAGAYHGHVDGLLADAGSGLATQGIPASPGVPEAAAAATIVVPWNDPDAIRAAVEQHPIGAHDVAHVREVADGVQVSHGEDGWPPSRRDMGMTEEGMGISRSKAEVAGEVGELREARYGGAQALARRTSMLP